MTTKKQKYYGSHAARRLRNEYFVQRIRDGEDFDAVLAEWGVDPTYARTLCTKHDVHVVLRRFRGDPGKSYQAIASLLTNNCSDAEHARNVGCSREYIAQVRYKLEQVGLGHMVKEHTPGS